MCFGHRLTLKEAGVLAQPPASLQLTLPKGTTPNIAVASRVAEFQLSSFKCRSLCANGTCRWQRTGELGGPPFKATTGDRCLSLPHLGPVSGTGCAQDALVPASTRASPTLKTTRLALPEETGFQQFAGFFVLVNNIYPGESF